MFVAALTLANSHENHQTHTVSLGHSALANPSHVGHFELDLPLVVASMQFRAFALKPQIDDDHVVLAIHKQ